MLTVIAISSGLIIIFGALMMYSASKKGKASKAEQNDVNSRPTIGRAQGSGDN